MRVVLDTNILVSACLTPEGASATIVELALLGVFTLSEYREVLGRTKFSRHAARIGEILAGIEEISVSVIPTTRLELALDEEDNRLLECAQAAHAEMLVTGNQKHFPKDIGNTRIVSPREFLTSLGY